MKKIALFTLIALAGCAHEPAAPYRDYISEEAAADWAFNADFKSLCFGLRHFNPTLRDAADLEVRRREYDRKDCYKLEGYEIMPTFLPFPKEE